MARSSRLFATLLLCSISLLSAFLLFQVQPVISKVILPWFGGGPGVWTTCMLFFQTVLFAGYAYAHGLTRLPKRWQWMIHGGLVIAAVLSLPISPGGSWKPTGLEDPTWRILGLLLANVALPYFVLSSTSPLVQVWFTEANGRSPWRLYALSNVGSLFALLSYPFLIEPAWNLGQQLNHWSWAFGGCAALLLVAVFTNRKTTVVMKPEQGSDSDAMDAAIFSERRPSWLKRTGWLILPALASVILLATINHVCQDVAVIPFLWVVPMSLYLLTFIICFEHERWYRFLPWAGLAAVAIFLVIGAEHIGNGLRANQALTSLASSMGWSRELAAFELAPDYRYELGLAFGAMFLSCMVCHGELIKLKPTNRYLTEFYLYMSAGGALGGLCVALIAPNIFTSYLEWPWGLLLCFVLCIRIVWGWAWSLSWRWVRLSTILLSALMAAAGLGLIMHWGLSLPHRVERVRNFYGAISVEEEHEDETGDLMRTLHHGGIVHGLQLIGGKFQQEPLTYYGRDTGIGLALASLKHKPAARVGVVGMGTGTVACYGLAGHTFRFYEINPEIERLARTHFTFLEDMEKRGGTVEVVRGDARLSLEREAESQQFDVMLLDAFSGDSVPVHLLTREAFQIYRRHMKPDGIIAVHISNRYLNLAPVIEKLAADMGLRSIRLTTGLEWLDDQTEYELLTNNEAFLRAHSNEPLDAKEQIDVPIWTDQNANLFQILDR